jgi:uncharacterized protein YeaO (DUF488 family)
MQGRAVGGESRMAIYLKRIYEDPAKDDGYRVLVDHLWPRGVKKEKAHIDQWLKEIAPSSGLRKWFGHNPEKWETFKRRYFEELDQIPGVVEELMAKIGEVTVTLLFSSKEEKFNNAVALREYLERKLGPQTKP